MKKVKDIWTLSARYLSGELKDPERQNFENLLGQDEDLRSEFNSIKLAWDQFEGGIEVDSNRSWDRLLSRLENEQLVKPKANTIALPGLLMRVAAIMVFAALMSFSVYYIFFSGKNNPVYVNQLQARANTSVFTLPEGSRVYLNKGSRLFYAENFPIDRKVLLEGEAFFEVMSDPQHPFMIETSTARIEVLGTSFNVKESTGDASTEVFVETGVVRLYGSDTDESIEMKKGDFAVSSGRKIESGTNIGNNYLSWKTLDFTFINENLQDVVSVLSRSYHVRIRIENQEIENLSLTSEYKGQSVDHILNTISLAFGIQYRNENNVYYLYKP